jgi:glycine cleavage system P protein (glycine dehydrogenase) subunit 1
LPRPAAPVVDALAKRGVLAGVPASRLWPGAGLDDLLIVAITEINTDEDAALLTQGLREVLR